MPFAITCDSCQSRFVLPESLYERKVKGKVVTIRCKQCHADITVDGVELAARSLPPTPPKIDRPAALEALWTVSYRDDDDRELSVPQIASALVRGEIGPRTIVWRDGMDEWKPIADVPELASLLPDGPPSNPQAPDRTGGFLGTGVPLRSPPPKRKTPPPTLLESAPESEAEPISVQPLSDASAAAIRDAAARLPSGAVALSRGLLFDEQEPVAASAELSAEPPSPAPERAKPKLPTPKPPLRALSASVPDVEPPPAPPAEEEEEPPPASGTPDLRTLTLALKKQENGSGQREMLAELGGTDDAAALLLPPTIDVSDLDKPPPEVDEPEEPPPSSELPSSEPPPSSEAPSSIATPSERARRKRKRKRAKAAAPKASDEKRSDQPARAAEKEKKPAGVAWLLLVAVAAAAFAWVLIRTVRKPSEVAEPAPETKAAEPAPPVAAPPTAEAVAAEVMEPAPADMPSPAANAPGPREVAGKPPATPVPEAKPKAEAKPETKPAEPTDPAKPAAKEGAATAAEAKPADTAAAATAAAPPSDLPPFNKEAAAAALSTAAAQAAACRKDGDPTGTASVVITFAPSGRVTSAMVSGAPFAGTPTGGCIAATMRGAKVPPFSGSHITVSKSVYVQ